MSRTTSKEKKGGSNIVCKKLDQLVLAAKAAFCTYPIVMKLYLFHEDFSTTFFLVLSLPFLYFKCKGRDNPEKFSLLANLL